MSAYLIFIREATLDPAELSTYARQAPLTLEGHAAEALAFYGRHQVLEGGEAEGIVILEFPTFDAARAWYASPAYQAAREHRFKGAKYRVMLVEGTEAGR